MNLALLIGFKALTLGINTKLALLLSMNTLMEDLLLLMATSVLALPNVLCHKIHPKTLR